MKNVIKDLNKKLKNELKAIVNLIRYRGFSFFT